MITTENTVDTQMDVVKRKSFNLSFDPPSKLYQNML